MGGGDAPLPIAINDVSTIRRPLFPFVPRVSRERLLRRCCIMHIMVFFFHVADILRFDSLVESFLGNTVANPFTGCARIYHIVVANQNREQRSRVLPEIQRHTTVYQSLNFARCSSFTYQY